MSKILKSTDNPTSDKLIDGGPSDDHDALVALIAAALADMRREDQHRRNRIWRRPGEVRTTAFRQSAKLRRAARS